MSHGAPIQDILSGLQTLAGSSSNLNSNLQNSNLSTSLNNLFGYRHRNSHRIPVDVVNTDSTIYIYAQVPGVKKEDFNIDFFNNELTVRVEKHRNYTQPEVAEIFYGVMERKITLPICVTKKDTVRTQYKNGILEIRVNKLVEEENKFSVNIDESE